MKITVVSLACAIAVVFVCSASATAQNSVTAAKQAVLSSHVTSSPAYAEILLRRTELEAELESLLIEYTDDYPKIKNIRQEIVFIDRETNRLAAVKASEAAKLTLALGRLIVRKATAETELSELVKTYKDEHPEVKRAKKKVEIYEKAIKEILG